jgi:hypothetical protein
MAGRIEFDWASTELENHLRPHWDRARRKFLAEYFAVYARWTRSMNTGAASDGQSQISALVQMCENRLRELFSAGPRRVLLQLLRSIPLLVIDQIAQLASLEKSADLVPVITLALVQFGDGKVSNACSSTPNAAVVSAEWLENFRSHLPEYVGSVLATALLLDYSRGWYRIAGKGGLMSPVETIEESTVIKAEKQLGGLRSDGLMILPSVTFVNDAELRPYLDRYEALQSARGAERFSGFLGVARDSESEISNFGDALWGVGVSHHPVQIRYPIRDLTLISNNYFFWALSVQPWFERLGYYADLFEARLGVGFDVVRHCCAGVSRCFAEQTAIARLEEPSSPREKKSGSPVFVHQLDNAEQEEHVSRFLYSITCRGMLRAPLEAWTRELSEELDDAGISDSRHRAAQFIKTFSRGGETDDPFVPAIFLECDDNTVAYDMISANEFLGFCLRRLTKQDDMPDLSIRRGLHFEKQCWDQLRSLNIRRAVDPGYTYIDQTGKQGEIDIAFFAGETLVILECKSWQKSAAYFRGDRIAVQQRLATLVAIYHSQCARNADHLFSSLNIGDRARIVSIIAVVEPEYIGPDSTELWFGDPEKMLPRVMTPDEIVDLCGNAGQLAGICERQRQHL